MYDGTHPFILTSHAAMLRNWLSNMLACEGTWSKNRVPLTYMYSTVSPILCFATIRSNCRGKYSEVGKSQLINFGGVYNTDFLWNAHTLYFVHIYMASQCSNAKMS